MPTIRLSTFTGCHPKGERPGALTSSSQPTAIIGSTQSKNEIKGKTVQFRTINEFRNPDYIEWWSEYSTDGGAHWVKMGGGSEKRQK